MKGQIKTITYEKNYGFIETTEGKECFFHFSAFCKDQISSLGEDVWVEFDFKPNGIKGYRAENCQVINAKNIETYKIPSQVYTSKTSAIKGWEILERTDFVAKSSSSDSPQSALEKLKSIAADYDANALINVTYYKTTGSKASNNGNGTYKYTVSVR